MAKADQPAVVGEAVSSRYWREDLARELLAAQAASGMSLQAFAKKHGLMPERLRRWKRKLEAPTASAADIRFLPVHIVDAQAFVEQRAASCIEVVAGGRLVRVGPNFCEATLLRVLQLLESAPC